MRCLEFSPARAKQRRTVVETWSAEEEEEENSLAKIAKTAKEEGGEF